MDRPIWAPPDVDIERPTAFRIYDYMLGGSYNFAADREVAEKAIATMPASHRPALQSRVPRSGRPLARR